MTGTTSAPAADTLAAILKRLAASANPKIRRWAEALLAGDRADAPLAVDATDTPPADAAPATVKAD
jgi:hypothetical protein